MQRWKPFYEHIKVERVTLLYVPSHIHKLQTKRKPFIFNKPRKNLSRKKVFDTAHFIDSLYTWSAFNTEGVGKIVGGAVAELTKVIDVDKVHLIGKLEICLIKSETWRNKIEILLKLFLRTQFGGSCLRLCWAHLLRSNGQNAT